MNNKGNSEAAVTTAKIIHVKTWEDYKQQALNSKPEILFYTIQRAPLSKPPIALRLVFTAEDKQYIFLDFPENKNLRQTKIQIKINKQGEAFIDEEDIKNFIYKEVQLKNLKIHSMEVLGY
ncbi:MAG: hypothetical protein QW261_16715 [Candidatus Jordarchaeaceae archaeon]